MNLSPRETEVVRELARGVRPKEAAAHMGITVSTLEKHRRHAEEKIRAALRADEGLSCGYPPHPHNQMCP